MKAVSAIIEYVLIFAIIIALAALGIPYALGTIQRSMELSEFQAIRNELSACNEKLVETARSGSANQCIFSVNKGLLTAQTDGIYYKLTSDLKICDAHAWTEIDEEKHIWQQCEVSDGTKTFWLKWYWPSEVTIEGQNFEGNITNEDKKIGDIKFDSPVMFMTLTVVVEFQFTPGQSGKIIEINRVGLTKDKAILSINIR
jgi:hypothetical protein